MTKKTEMPSPSGSTTLDSGEMAKFAHSFVQIHAGHYRWLGVTQVRDGNKIHTTMTVEDVDPSAPKEPSPV